MKEIGLWQALCNHTPLLHALGARSVIAAICLLETRSVDEIVARLTPAELEQVIKIVGRSPRGYPPGAYDALKGKRNLAQPQPPIERLSRNGALEFGQPAARTNPGTEHSRRIHGHRFNAPRLEVPQTSTERATATTGLCIYIQQCAADHDGRVATWVAVVRITGVRSPAAL